MPIIFTGSHICDKCKKAFKWNYFEIPRQKISSQQLMVETIPPNITLVHFCKKNGNGVYKIGVNCPYCDFDNIFTFSESE